MKRVWLMLLILSTPASAFLMMETGEPGSNPSLYADNFVFESNGYIKLFNIDEQSLRVVDEGSYPHLFAYKIVFQDNNGEQDLVRFADVRDLIAKNIHVGRHPDVYSNTVAFSAKESDLGVDYDNDGLLNDNIILYYDLETEELVNTKAIGDYPSVGKDFIVFETAESELGVDKDMDGDLDDTFIRVYSFQRGVFDTGLTGARPDVSPEDIAVFSSDGEIVVFDVAANDYIKTGLKGESPSIYENLVMFSSDGKLATYDINNEKYALLDIPGEQPSLFDLAAAFVSGGRLRFLRAQDLDEDGVVDIIDNCPHLANKAQDDSDYDGLGNKCDDTPFKVEKKQSLSSGKEKIDSDAKTAELESSSFPWWLLILLIPIIGIGVWIYPKWAKKRRKSFGF
ncbi:hypothetical protein KY329_02580 [Candidatus Woesearchaeota archaeon]|nr:hypothetical protein [Candidatus Woesearchaeota archaeon]